MILISVCSYKCLTVVLYDYAHFFVTLFKNTVFVFVCKDISRSVDLNQCTRMIGWMCSTAMEKIIGILGQGQDMRCTMGIFCVVQP